MVCVCVEDGFAGRAGAVSLGELAGGIGCGGENGGDVLEGLNGVGEDLGCGGFGEGAGAGGLACRGFGVGTPRPVDNGGECEESEDGEEGAGSNGSDDAGLDECPCDDEAEESRADTGHDQADSSHASEIVHQCLPARTQRAATHPDWGNGARWGGNGSGS